MPLTPLAEAQALVLAACHPLPVAEVPLADARGLVLAAEVRAPDAVPPFDNTAMDGFAVRAADTVGASDAEPVRLTVTGTQPAGPDRGLVVGPGTAVRIMTGAPMPVGADAVVMVERSSRVGEDGVDLTLEVSPGTSVRRAGDDLQPGQEVLAPGAVLGPAGLGVLASIGLDHVPAHRRPRVGVFSTGDELVPAGQPLRPGQIRDSNRTALLALLERDGLTAIDLGLVPDDEERIAEAIARGVASCDALITSGGVSMGDFDFVKVVLDRVADMRWLQLAIKPAKPFAFGLLAGASGRQVPVFGLPGNPVSSLVSFELLARPALRQMMAHPHIDRPLVAAVAVDGLPRRPDGKTHYVRVSARFASDGRVHVQSVGAQGSHQLAATSLANAIAVVPDGAGVPVGGTVDTMLLSAAQWVV